MQTYRQTAIPRQPTGVILDKELETQLMIIAQIISGLGSGRIADRLPI